jgi:predicted AlkP superfamily pyrophosphatase or phosphodiesterase
MGSPSSHGFEELSPALGLLKPEYEDRCIVNLLPSLARLLGFEGHRPPPKIWSALQPLEGCEKVIVLLLDGMGYEVLRRLSASREGRWLRRLADRGVMVPITTVFPTTTTSAMVSFCTGQPPKRHGVTGYTIYLKEAGAVVNMVDFSPAIEGRREVLSEAGLDPREIVSTPTLFEKMRRSGIRTLLLTRRPLKDTSLSKICHSGADTLPCVTFAEMAVQLRKIIERERQSQLVYAYWDGYDAVAHLHGPDSEEAWAEARALITTLSQSLPGNSRVGLVITADHGQDTVERGGQVDILHDNTLNRLVSIPPTGDARATILHTPPQNSERLLQYIKRFSDISLIIPSQRAVELGLLGRGRAHPSLGDRIGQYLMLCKPGYAFHYRYRGREQEVYLRGLHGSLSSQELLVPLLVGRL